MKRQELRAMQGLDLSDLTTSELRELLRLARSKRDGLMADRLQWELAERAAQSTRLGFPVDALLTGHDDEPEEASEEDLDADLAALRLPERPRRSRGLPAAAWGLAAGCVLTTAAFLGASAMDELRHTSGRPVARAPPHPAPLERPAPKPIQRVASAGPAGVDAVAGVLAPAPFPARPPPAPPPVVEPPPPASEAAPPPPVVQVGEVEKPPPPTPEPAAKLKPRPQIDAPKPKRAKPVLLAKAPVARPRPVPSAPKKVLADAGPRTGRDSEDPIGDLLARSATP